jgi:hypothetical protein
MGVHNNLNRTATLPSAQAVAEVLRELLARAERELGDETTKKLTVLLRELMLRLPHKDFMKADLREIRRAGMAMAAGGRGKDEMRLLQTGLRAFYDLASRRGLTICNPMLEQRRASESAPTSTLIVCPKGPIVSKLIDNLGIEHDEVAVEAEPSAAIELVRWYPFRRIICWHPLAEPGIEKFLRELRTANSPSWKCACVVISDVEHLDQARRLVGHGVGRVYCEDSIPSLAPVFDEIESAELRLPIRIPLRMTGAGSGGVMLCQSENISASGLLIRTSSKLQPGQRIACEFTLPGEDRPIRSTAEVVRKTTEGRETTTGLGARFVSFDADGKRRLSAHLNAQRMDTTEAFSTTSPPC